MIFTIGYGNRTIREFLALLKRENIRYLGDVRSFPRSGYNPDFSQTALQMHLRTEGISYVFLGEELGGNPDDDDIRVRSIRAGSDAFRVDYQKLQETERFKHGIERLRRSQQIDARIALMCSELRPEDCHRTRLIGEALSAQGFLVTHIDELGNLHSQADIMLRISKGQPTLPGFGPPPKALLSSRGWSRPDRDKDGDDYS